MKKVSILLASLLSLSCCGCSSNFELKVPQQDITIEVIAKSQNVEFWDTTFKGAIDASNELGINVICEATPTESDIDMQIQMLQNAINNNVDAIVLAPLDTTALNDTLKVATSKNIPIITIDSPVTYSNVSSLVGTQNETASSIAGRNMASFLNETGDVLVVTHGDDSISTAKQRKDGFINEIEQNHTNMKIVSTINGQNDTEITKNLVIDFLQKNPNVKGIYACNEVVAIGVCQAVVELNRTDISIIGFDSSDAEINYIKNGVLNGTMVQNPYLMGYLGVRNAYKIINNESVDSTIDTGITYVDALNLTDEDIEILLYPMGKKEG